MGEKETGGTSAPADKGNAATQQPATSSAPEKPPTAPPTAPAASKAPEKSGGDPPSPEWIAARVAQGQSSLLRKHGFDSEGQLAEKLKRLDELETERLSEQEKAQKLIQELTPRAQEADTYKQRFGSVIDQQFADLPESIRDAIDATAQGDALKRHELMGVMRAAGVLNAAPAAPPSNNGGAPQSPPAPPAPVTTAPSPSPPGGTPQSAFAKWDSIKNSIEKSLFYRANAIEIERTRPA